MASISLLLTLIVLISSEINGQKRVVPLQALLNILHREPPIAINAKNKYRQNIQELWFKQPLDHFDHNEQTWQMRYLRNDQHYKPGGPIFIYVGGEWEISDAFLLTGQMFDMAQEHNGIMYYTEHRFYGKSWPTNNTAVHNLQYLHSRQALADLAKFIRQQKHDVEGLQNSPVILTGGSYAGSMVTWFTELYPGTVTAAWASSAPMRAKLDFFEFLENVGDAIKLVGGKKCYQRIQNGISIMQQRFTTTTNADVILKQLKLCNNFDAGNKLDLAAFFNAIGNHFSALVQSKSDSIMPTCKYLLSLHSDDDLAAFTHYLTDIFGTASHGNGDFCIDLSYKATKQQFIDVNNYDSGSRQWLHQTCNEFGWFTTSIASPTPFGPKQESPFGRFVNLNYFRQICADAFDTTHTVASMAQNIELTNNLYSVKQPNDVVIMTHGQLDPWISVGWTHGANVLLIPGYSHVADLSSININDSVAMNVAKVKVASFVRQRIWQARHGTVEVKRFNIIEKRT